ncbi:MAG: ABC transporter permease [Thermoleophilaceae bacterium]
MHRADPGLTIGGRLGGGDLRRARELVLHLAAREIAARHRFTLLGWAWPLARQLAQLGVLYVVFTSIVDLGIESYAAFLFTGIVAWGWFAAAVSEGADAVVAQRHLVFRPQCPAAVLPVVPVVVALVDALIALPVLLVLVAAGGELHASALFLPVIAAVQLVLSCGIAWLAAATSVYLRDVRQLVGVGLLLLFYLTPVFYDLSRIPDDYEWALRLNPLTTILEAYRAVLIEQRLPDAVPLLIVTAASAAVAAAGLLVFQRLRGGFVDEL